MSTQSRFFKCLGSRVNSIAVLGSVLLAMTAPLQAATFLVTSNADTAGSTCGATCTLRQAINAANLTPAADVINFSFTGFSSGEVLIQAGAALPNITQPLTINGYSLRLAVENTDPITSNAKLRVRIHGAGAGATSIGLSVCASDVVIKGLSLTGWSGAAIGYGLTPSSSNCAGSFTGGKILGNFIGVTTAGDVAAGNFDGLRVSNSVVAVGSSLVADRNIVSANPATAIDIRGSSAAGSSVLGNLIGTDRSGAQDLGGSYGITLSASNVTIGNAAAPNLIRYHFVGIRLSAVVTVVDNDLQNNRFSDNDLLAIDLGDDGVVNPNDTNDTDVGANGLQNRPLVTAVTRIGGGLHVAGSLDVPITINPLIYRLALYASATCGLGGNGEGQILLGTHDVALRGNSSETFSFDHTTPTAIPIGSVLTLTVDGPDGTSEFTGCTAIDAGPILVNSSNDVVDVEGCTAVHCSLREAIEAANSRFGPNLIQFAIASPATGEILIQPGTLLPSITDALAIDGYSQSGALANTDPLVSNAAIRIRVDGSAIASGDQLFDICANDSSIRGLSITGMTSGLGNAVSVCASSTSGVVIAGNFIGLASDGATNAGNDVGVNLIGNATIGGALAVDRNLISKNFTGIQLGSAGAAILGNLIGTDRSGALNKGNSLRGIRGIGSAVNANIGSAAAPNLIRFNQRGIDAVGNSTTVDNLVWTHNRIFENNSLGIDFGVAGATANDTDDLDSGPNELQNFPVLARAERSANGIRIDGTLDVVATANGAPYVIGVYANTICDSSGFGEGERLLGAATVLLTQGTKESFSFELITNDPLEAGVKITTTATGPEGSSEFSQCIIATDPPPILEVNSTSDTDDGTCDAQCTLREAINRANVQPGENRILFTIPGTGPHEISLTSLLPVVTEALVIDGYSQSGSAPNSSTSGSDAVIRIKLNAAGLANALRICTGDRVEIAGLAIGAASGAAISSKTGAGACNLSGPLVVHGNFIGLNPDGSAASNQSGLLLTDTLATIGSGAPADRNLIANSSSFGLKLVGSGSSGSSVRNTLFGLGVDGVAAAGNLGTALELLDTANVTVGGDGNEANHLRFNQRGIVVKGNPSIGNRVHGNEFSDHAGMAIDLSASGSDTDGITLNDPDDADSGPNQLQNAPVLTSATATANTMTINGSLDVDIAPGSNIRTVTFYESASCDSNSNREGEILLTSMLINFSNSAENFAATINVPPPNDARFITAVATAQQGDTSEFSNCLPAPLASAVGDAIFADSFE